MSAPQLLRSDGKPCVCLARALCVVAGLALLVAGQPAFGQAVSQQNSPTIQAEPTADPQALFAQAQQAEGAGDYANARPLYEQAAALGHARAHYQLGFLLVDGLGGPRDVEAAIGHLRAAAQGGITLALVPLIYALDDYDDPQLAPDAAAAARAAMELARRDLGMAGDTIMFWSRPLRRQVQTYLGEAGYYTGPIDGLIGEGSLGALRRFANSRSPLPDGLMARPERFAVTRSGVSAGGAEPVSLPAAPSLAQLRAAFPGLAIDGVPAVGAAGALWRVSLDGTDMIDWHVRDDEPPMLQLPGKPRGSLLSLGMAREGVLDSDLQSCARLGEQPEHENGEQPQGEAERCQSRMPYVQLVFEGDPAALSAIEITLPPSLRLAGGQ